MKTNTVTKRPRQALTAEPACILRWVFHRGPDTLTCAVESDVNGSSYDVCVLPHWNLSGATVEHFEVPASALRRHAEIASRLRHAGWLAQYGASRSRASRLDRDRSSGALVEASSPSDQQNGLSTETSQFMAATRNQGLDSQPSAGPQSCTQSSGFVETLVNRGSEAAGCPNRRPGCPRFPGALSRTLRS